MRNEIKREIFFPNPLVQGRAGELTNVLGLLACETWRKVLPAHIRVQMEEWALEESGRWSSSQATEAAWNYETMRRGPILGWVDNPSTGDVRVWLIGGSVTIPYFPTRKGA